MESNKTNKKYYIVLIASCFALYLMSISIKMVYSAELVSIISYFDTSKSNVSLGLTIYYIMYAVTQLIISASKIKIDMHKFLLWTTVLSALSFGAVIFTNEIWQVWLILGLNGILQSSVYGGVVQCLTKYLPDSWFNRASIILSFGFAIGIAIAYGISALGVALFDWKFAFIVFAILLILSLALFCLVLNRSKRHFGEVDHGATSKTIDESTLRQPIERKSFIAILGFIMVAEFFVCSLYYGISNWVPSLLKEVHGVDESYSMLITILVPVSMMPGPVAANVSTEKTGKVYTVCSAFLGICTMCLLAMIFMYETNIIVALILSLISLFFNRGIVNLLSGYMPFKLNRVIPASKSSMMINAIACVGAAIMPFVTGLIMDHLGWTAYYISMFAIAAIATVMFLFGIKYSKKLLP